MMRTLLTVAMVASFAAAAMGAQVVYYDLKVDSIDTDYQNYVASWEAGDEPGTAFPTSSTASPVDPMEGSMRWDVTLRTAESGDDNNNGVACAVFSLELHEGDWSASDPPDNTTLVSAKYYSDMNDGDFDGGIRDDVLEAAALCLSFTPPATWPGDSAGTGPAKVDWDTIEGGPNMDRIQFPSTGLGPNDGNFPGGRRTTGSPSYKAGTGTTTAAAGELLGMGAGYSQLDTYLGASFELQPANYPGIGIPAPDSLFNLCYRGLGQVAVFEGQIDLTGLDGTYTLICKPGAGTNVLKDYSCIFDPTPGSFAEAATGVGSKVVFDVTGPQGVDVVQWESVRHTGLMGDAFNPIGILLNADDAASAGYPDDVASESRWNAVGSPANGVSGIKQIVVTLSGAASLLGPAPTVTQMPATPVAASDYYLQNGDTELVIEFMDAGVGADPRTANSTLAEYNCFEIDITGVVSLLPAADPTCMIRSLVGDVTGKLTLPYQDGIINLDDFVAARTAAKTLPALDLTVNNNARFNVDSGPVLNLDDAINIRTIAKVTSVGQTVDCP